MYIDSSKHITPEPTPTHTTGLIWITTQTNVIKYWLHQLLQIPCMYSILYLIWNMLQIFFSSKKILGDLFAEKETKRRPILAKGLLRRPRSPKGDLFGNTEFKGELATWKNFLSFWARIEELINTNQTKKTASKNIDFWLSYGLSK